MQKSNRPPLGHTNKIHPSERSAPWNYNCSNFISMHPPPPPIILGREGGANTMHHCMSPIKKKNLKLFCEKNVPFSSNFCT